MSRHPAEVLDELAAGGGEPGGAVAVVRDGTVEVDHGVGTADGTRPWSPDTLVMTFSVAKPLAALTVLDAVADGHLELDQPVASLWPEYAQNGKQGTTVRHLLAHQAGLPTFPQAAADLEYDDREALVRLLAEAAPDHPPGAEIGEHALTYGHLLDEVLRRATDEPLAERFSRIAADAGWDLHLRVEPHDLPRVAALVDPTGTWRTGFEDDARWAPAITRPPGLLDADVLNSDRFRGTSFPAVSLYATAGALAAYYADVVRPGGRVATRLGHDLWRAHTEPAATGHDLVIGREVTWSLGFQVDEEEGRTEIGMGGAGGCVGWAVPAHGYGAAYVSRGLGAFDRADHVWDAVAATFSPSDA